MAIPGYIDKIFLIIYLLYTNFTSFRKTVIHFTLAIEGDKNNGTTEMCVILAGGFNMKFL